MKDIYADKYLQLGLKIAYYRKLRGLTQEMLSARLQTEGCDITRSALAKIEVGQRHIYYADEIIILKKILNAPFEEILRTDTQI